MKRAEAMQRIREAIIPVPGPGLLVDCRICQTTFAERAEKHVAHHARSHGFDFWFWHAAYFGVTAIRRLRRDKAANCTFPLERWMVRRSRRLARVGWVDPCTHAFLVERGLCEYLTEMTRALHAADADALLDQVLEAAERGTDAHAG